MGPPPIISVVLLVAFMEKEERGAFVRWRRRLESELV